MPSVENGEKEEEKDAQKNRLFFPPQIYGETQRALRSLSLRVAKGPETGERKREDEVEVLATKI